MQGANRATRGGASASVLWEGKGEASREAVFRRTLRQRALIAPSAAAS